MTPAEYGLLALSILAVGLLIVIEWLLGVSESLRVEVQHYRDDAIRRAKARILIPQDVAKDFADAMKVRDQHRTPPTETTDETPAARRART